MKVRPVEESAERYFRNSMRAYLEGKKDIRWLAAMIGPEPGQAARALQVFTTINTPMDAHRRIEFMNWLSPRLSAPATGSNTIQSRSTEYS